MNGTNRKIFGKSGRSGAVLTLASIFIMAMALVFGFAARDSDGDDGGSSFDTALVGKWVKVGSGYEISITSATDFKMNGTAMTGYSLSTSGGVLTVTLAGTEYGTVTYSINSSSESTLMTLSSPSSALVVLFSASTYIKQ
jgi:hypothetical protein